MESDYNLSVEDIYASYMRKIQIAIAIHVIKSKPPEFATPKDYAVHLQEGFLAKEAALPKKHTIFEEEKGSLMSDLKSVTTVIPPNQFFGCQPDSSDDELLLADDADEGQEDQKLTVINSNIDFIDALVHIRNITSSKSSIPTDKFNVICSSIAEKLLPTHKDKKLQAQDSGYDSFIAVYPSQPTCVLSSDINQVLRENSVDVMLAKCVGRVLEAITNLVRVRWSRRVSDRLVSVTSTYVKAIVNLVDCVSNINEQNYSRDECLKWVKSFIKTILATEDVYVVHIQCLRCKVVTDICASRYLCADCISYLIDLIENLKDNIIIKTKEVGEKSFGVYMLAVADEENIHYLYRILKELLTRYKTIRSQSHPKRKKKPKKKMNVHTANLCDLWQCEVEEDDDADANEEHDARRKEETRWMTVLDKANLVFEHNYTHLMYLNFESLNVLEVAVDSSDDEASEV